MFLSSRWYCLLLRWALASTSGLHRPCSLSSYFPNWSKCRFAAHGRYTYEDVVELSGLMRNDLFAIEVAAGVEDSCSALFDARNVPDDLFEAYRLASPGIAADHSLHERYLEMVDRGPESVEGFISNLKGKLGELRIQEHLQQEFPGYSFEIAADQNQPVWDILATQP